MNTNKVIEIEGEVDEDEFQDNLKHLTPQPPPKDIEQKPQTSIDYSNLETIEKMIKGIQHYYEKELNSALNFCENLSFQIFINFIKTLF